MNKNVFNLKAFLKSDAHVATFAENYRNLMLIKAPAPEFPNDLSLIYTVDLWRHGGLNEKADLAGIYQSESHILWNPNWKMRELYDNAPESMQEGLTLRILKGRLEDISQLATTMLRQEAERGTFLVTDMAESAYYSVEEYIAHRLKRDAEDCFMKRETPAFGHRITLQADEMNWRDMLAAIAAPNALAKRYMEDYVQRKAKIMNRTLETLPLLIAAVNELNADSSHPYHLRRKIAESVNPDLMKTVRVIIERDNIHLDTKVEARAIRQLLYSTVVYDTALEAAPRKTWRHAFGWNDIRPEDIVSITYGKKTLYTKEEQ